MTYLVIAALLGVGGTGALAIYWRGRAREGDRDITEIMVKLDDIRDALARQISRSGQLERALLDAWEAARECRDPDVVRARLARKLRDLGMLRDGAPAAPFRGLPD
jgi:hypothetical protein